jgi:hypothetical protein
MKRSTLTRWISVTAIAMAAVVTTAPSSMASGSQVVVAGHAGVRVWVDGGDIFPSYGDVSIWLRADRDCYTTLFLVDTAGYLHVLLPTSPYDPSWIRGGRTYRYRGCDIGFDRLDGVGIAHVFAVGSPVPFDYSGYGAAVFAGGFGFRVYGDPYVACRDFYLSLLPVTCRWDYVGVSCSRFYVRQWVRYPAYLCCAAPGVHVRFGDSCRACSNLYVSYRHSVSDPDDVFRPAARFKSAYNARDTRYVPANREATGRIERATSRTVKYDARGDVVRRSVPVVTKNTNVRAPARTRVVSTSRSMGAVTGKARATATGTGRGGAVVHKTRGVESQSVQKNARASSARGKETKKQARHAR